jgi:hypothetical protein
LLGYAIEPLQKEPSPVSITQPSYSSLNFIRFFLFFPKDLKSGVFATFFAGMEKPRPETE